MTTKEFTRRFGEKTALTRSQRLEQKALSRAAQGKGGAKTQSIVDKFVARTGAKNGEKAVLAADTNRQTYGSLEDRAKRRAMAGKGGRATAKRLAAQGYAKPRAA